MPDYPPDEEYDPADPLSILNYAKNLVGLTPRDIVDGNSEFSAGNKGKIGEIVEMYFGIRQNSRHAPDFEKAKVELKTTSVKKLRGGNLVPKERLALSMINYFQIVHESFEESVLGKSRNILLVTLEYVEGEHYLDFKIIRVDLMAFSAEDLRVMKNDFCIIRDMVLEGRAHEISGRLTKYLEAAPKGQGKGRGMRRQPYSDILAKPRAFCLKQSFMKRIWEEMDVEDILIKSPNEWKSSETFEEMVLRRFEPYKELDVSDIFSEFGCRNEADKGRFAKLARLIMGVKGKKVDEFEKAGIIMKTIRVKTNGTPKESMSFPYFRHEEIAEGTWEESDFHETLVKQFFFVIFRMEAERTILEPHLFG